MLQSTVLPPPTGSAVRLMRALALEAALRGALRSGLLETLARWQPCSSRELATRAHLAPLAVDLTLDALAAGAVVAEDRDGWALTAPPEVWSAVVALGDHVVDQLDGVAVRSGRDDGVEAALVQVEHRATARLAEAIAPTLLRVGDRVLALGTSGAAWADAAGALGAVLVEIEHERAGGPALRREASNVEPGAFDVVLVGTSCRTHPDAENARAFARCRTLLAPGGRFVVADPFAAMHAHEAALEALAGAARQPVRSAWRLDDYERWLAGAGFAAAAIRRIEHAGTCVLATDPSMP